MDATYVIDYLNQTLLFMENDKENLSFKLVLRQKIDEEESGKFQDNLADLPQLQ